MYTVIIIDDETWICKLISKIVPWERLGFKIEAETGNGHTALDLIEKHRPNLVITDIRMPGLDGIGLIKAVRERNIDTEFIIISGYSDFEYARSAVIYNAFGYLLKPLDNEEFEKILLKVKEKIDAKLSVKDKIEYSNKKMLERAIYNIINRIDTGIGFEELNNNYEINLKEGLYRIAVFKVDSLTKDQFDADFIKNYGLFINRIKKAYSKIINEIIWISEDSPLKTMALLNYDTAQSRNVIKIMKDITAEFETCFQGVYQMTVGIGNTVEQLKDIGVSFKSAENAVKARVALGCGKIIDSQSIQMAEIKNIIDVQEEKRLEMSFEIFDTNNAVTEISGIFRKVEKLYPDNAIIYHMAASEIINILYLAMGRKDLNLDSFPDKQAALSGLDACATKEKIERYVNNLYKAFYNLYEGERQKNGNKIINEIKVFVTMNYMLDIGLDDVARLVCLNSTYVSEIFKKKTGENFSEYLISYRIAIAKDLLKDVKYKVVDISQMVGYKDSKYFSRIFKQKVGVNPSDYRNLYI